MVAALNRKKERKKGLDLGVCVNAVIFTQEYFANLSMMSFIQLLSVIIIF